MASTSSSRATSPSVSRRRRRRSSNNELQTQTREYAYAVAETSISEWLKCPICLNPFVEPLQAATCEHIFCKECIVMHVESSFHYNNNNNNNGNNGISCPTCRSAISRKQLKPAALIRNMVDSLLVKCPHEKRGCTSICERSFVDIHAKKDCGWAWIGEYLEQAEGKRLPRGRCECGKKILRKDWQSHVSNGECSVERIKCKYADGEQGCHQVLKESEMEDHIVHCPACPVYCSHCNLQLPKEQMEQHEVDCDDAIVDCSLSRFGCTWQGRRGEFDSTHSLQCQLKPLERYLLKQEQDVAALRQENTRLAENLHSIKLDQEKAQALVQKCVSSLGSTYIDSEHFSSQESPSTFQAEELSNHLVIPISSPIHPGRPPSSPPITLQGRSGTTFDIPATLPRLNSEEDVHHLSSTSAPVSRADFPWQWPDTDSPLPQDGSQISILQQPNTISDSLSDIHAKLNKVFDQLNQLDRRIEDNHVLGLNANFEASRAHEELNSVRHGLHALRMSLLMHQQRGMPGQENRPNEAMNTNTGVPNAMPFVTGMNGPSMMGLRRFWTGWEQTKL